MSRLWFTADLHLGHGNIIKYCHRPHLSKKESLLASTEPRGGWNVSRETIVRHDDALIAAINERVAEKDSLGSWVIFRFALSKRQCTTGKESAVVR